jgi:hypothetical protein
LFAIDELCDAAERIRVVELIESEMAKESRVSPHRGIRSRTGRPVDYSQQLKLARIDSALLSKRAIIKSGGALARFPAPPRDFIIVAFPSRLSSLTAANAS